MFNESQLTQEDLALSATVSLAEASGASQLTELSDSDLDGVSGGFSMGDLSSFFEESGSFFSERNVFFEQTSFAGRDGAGGKTTFIFQGIDSGNTQRAGGTAGGGGCGGHN